MGVKAANVISDFRERVTTDAQDGHRGTCLRPLHIFALLCFCFADNVNQFKNRLDKHWKMHDVVFNYHADFAETGGLA